MMKLVFLMLLVMLTVISIIEAVRRLQSMEAEYPAYFQFSDGRNWKIRNIETIIGRARNADLRIYLPGIQKSEYITGVDLFHGFLTKKQHQFWLKNISQTEPIVIIHNGISTVLKPDDSCEIYHDTTCVFGNCQLIFYKGVV